MTPKPKPVEIPSTTAPCPKCGYDLRGHPDPAYCPECGVLAYVGASLSEAARWVDRRILDLWSISVLQTTGCVAATLAILCIQHGFSVAVILGMLAMSALCVATVWFLALLPGIVMSTRRPRFRTLDPTHLRRLYRLCVFDVILMAAVPLVFMALTRA